MLNREEADLVEANRQKKKEEKKDAKKDSPIQSSPISCPWFRIHISSTFYEARGSSSKS